MRMSIGEVTGSPLVGRTGIWFHSKRTLLWCPLPLIVMRKTIVQSQVMQLSWIYVAFLYMLLWVVFFHRPNMVIFVLEFFSDVARLFECTVMDGGKAVWRSRKFQERWLIYSPSRKSKQFLLMAVPFVLWLKRVPRGLWSDCMATLRGLFEPITVSEKKKQSCRSQALRSENGKTNRVNVTIKGSERGIQVANGCPGVQEFFFGTTFLESWITPANFAVN